MPNFGKYLSSYKLTFESIITQEKEKQKETDQKMYNQMFSFNYKMDKMLGQIFIL